jgi:competence protein ComEC
VLGLLTMGVFVGEWCGPSAGSAAIAFAGVAAGAALALRRRVLPAVVALGIVVAAVGCALMQRALDGRVHWPLAAEVEERADAVVDVTLVDDPDGSRFSTRVLARVSRARVGRDDWTDAGGRTLVVVAGDAAGPRVGLLAAGDHVRLRGWLRPLEAYDERLRWRHAVARFDATDVVAFRGPDGILLRVANTLRDTVLGGTDLLPPTERALVAGFLLGDTRALPDDVLEQFRAAGLSHLLAVSGSNVAFVLVLAGPALHRLPRRGRLVATLGVLVVFGAMTRWEPSVLRACAMAACAVVALHAGRPARAMRTLAIAAVVLVAIDPFLVHSIAFLLSCGACLGIALLAPALAERLRGPRWLREGLATTAAAQIGVTPVLLPVFGSVPLIALVANLVAVPIAAPLTTWGLAAGAFGGVVGDRAPGLAALAQVPTRLLADGVLGVADAAARVPLSVDLSGAVALMLAGALVVGARRARMLRRHALVVPPR